MRGTYFTVESALHPKGIAFASLQARLIISVNARIRNGEFTERGLARLLGVSQTQVHNILKGARKLSPELGDQLLCKFGMSLVQFLEDAELVEEVLARHLLQTIPPLSGPKENPEPA